MHNPTLSPFQTFVVYQWLCGAQCFACTGVSIRKLWQLLVKYYPWLEHF